MGKAKLNGAYRKAALLNCISLFGLLCCLGYSKNIAAANVDGAPRERASQFSHASPCAAALSSGIICAAANEEGLRLLRQRGFAGAVVVEDVRSGALVAYASLLDIDSKGPGEVRTSALNVTSPILPLSVSKVFLAASWWDNGAAASKACKAKACMSDAEVHEMLVSGSDSAGKKLALELRQIAGGEKALKDMNAYGFPAEVAKHPVVDENFWGFIEPALRDKLIPASAYISVKNDTADEDWASAFSIGETGFNATLLHISRFMEAIGNGGVMIAPSARIHAEAVVKPDSGMRVMQASTAEHLQSAMLDNVLRGTAVGILGRMGDKWKIGGKTGTNSDPDGIFAGLVFDASGAPRYAFATYIKRGGKGGGVAAEVSADLVKFIVGN
jgi:cell division protein FtsI/penicillin-binding protein 2